MFEKERRKPLMSSLGPRCAAGRAISQRMNRGTMMAMEISFEFLRLDI